MVSDAQKAAIKASWAGIDLQKVGTAFYCQLSSKAPDVYNVFKLGADPKSATAAAQGLKVMQFIDVAVKNLGDMGVVQGKLDELAQRHTKYGAKKAHFGPAGPCLLAALAETQGAKFTAEAKEAWTAFYTIVAAGISAQLS